MMIILSKLRPLLPQRVRKAWKDLKSKRHGVKEQRIEVRHLEGRLQVMSSFLVASDITIEEQREIMEDVRRKPDPTHVFGGDPAYLDRKFYELPEYEFISYAAGLDLPGAHITYHYTRNREFLEQASALKAQGLGSQHPDILAVLEKATLALGKAREETRSVREILRLQHEGATRQREIIQHLVANPYLDVINFADLREEAIAINEALKMARDLVEKSQME